MVGGEEFVSYWGVVGKVEGGVGILVSARVRC